METLANSVVENDPENDLYTEFIKDGAPARQQIQDKLNAKFSADVITNLTPKDPQYAVIYKYYNELNEGYNQGQVERLGSFIKQHPDAFASMYVLNTMITIIPADKAQMYYDELTPSYKNTSYAASIQKTIDAKKITAIGKVAPDFEQPDTSGKVVKLSDFKGQYVLLDFWASWCGPCREENPNVVKAYQKFHGKGFTVLSVSLDQPGKKANWLNAIHHDGLTWTQVSDLQFWNNAAAVLYGIKAIPQNFLIDKDGKIIAVNIKGDDLNKKLTELFPN
jgi:peroxiredoxin